MLKNPFVILDLETSGTDPKLNDIIEVAMIRYENGKEVKRHDSLIKIDFPLPTIISIITGITDNELQKSGREKNAVFREIEDMIKGAYLVAHNIDFDAGFLRAKGVELDVLGFIDTIPLAQIMMPDATSYSLESLADDLGIEHANKHRAMGDVEATLDLFKYLCDRADELPASVISEIKDCLKRSSWDGGIIFETTIGSTRLRRGSTTGSTIGSTTGSTIGSTTGSTIGRVLAPKEILQEGGILQKFWPDFEPRPQQEQMAESVMSAFEEEYHLICEAPTGVGKSLAYLIAAANIAIKNKSKVIISTNTINLQHQLYEKDVPLLQKIYSTGDWHAHSQNVGNRHAYPIKGHNNDLRFALLKGRKNYLCLRRFSKFKNRQRFSDEEVILLIKILVWQSATQTGEGGEIHLTKNESLIWDFELCSDKKYCSPQKCKGYGECYLHRARKRAEEADIIIVNHALLCADIASEGGLLPDYQYLVIDEAHNFEESATDAFGITLKQENFSLPLKIIKGHLADIKKHYQGTLFAGQMAMDKIDEVYEQIGGLESAVENLFTVIAYFVNRNVQDSGYVENLLIDQTILGMGEWLNLGISADETCGKLRMWLLDLRHFLEAWEINSCDNSGQNEFIAEISQESDILSEQITALQNFFADGHGGGTESGQSLVRQTDNTQNEKCEMPNVPPRRMKSEMPNVKSGASGYIRWLTSDHRGTVTVNLAPYTPGNILQEKLYSQKKSIILTSATLGVKLANGTDGVPEQHPFTYLRAILNLDERFEELIIDSPFNFETQTYVMVPDNALPISSPKSVQQLTPFFTELIKTVKGGMMTLFTSYKMIETLYLNLMEFLRNSGTKLLAQRINGGRNKIMKAYMNDPAHSVLFGTASFWEGVDIKGEALTTLVIHKLPFDVPSDPIVKARSEMFHNGFYEYMVPRAILKFRQGFGRLIRTKKDYGVMIVLDNRVLNKDYGQLFLQALPKKVTLEKTALAEIPSNVERWLGLNKSDKL